MGETEIGGGPKKDGKGRSGRGKCRWPPAVAVADERPVREGEGNGGKGGRVHDVVGEGGKDRLSQENMGSAGVDQNGRGGDGTQEGRRRRVVVRIVAQ
jgi:hypothetical protein